MSQPTKKSGKGEIKWPYKEAMIKGWGTGSLKVVFNEDQGKFDYDLIRIVIGGADVLISRDDLAQVLIVGYEARKEYQEAMDLEAKQLKAVDLDRL